MDEIFAKVNYSDKSLYESVKQAANKKFGAGNSYVKNLWIHKEYKKRGGKAQYKGKKPTSKKIKDQVKGSIEIDFSEDFWSSIDSFEE
jgi:hypothetical protein